MLGLFPDFAPKFVRQYAQLKDTVRDAVSNFSLDVKGGKFPSDKESF